MKLALIDFSPIAFAQYYGHVQRDTDLETAEDKIHYLKFMILSKLADIQKQVKANKSILAFDSNSWRKDHFKFYKAKRDMQKADKALDYEIIFNAIDELIPILKQTNYTCLRIDKAEADDIIAVACNTFQDHKLIEKIIIVSKDKDFQQLTNKKVALYDYTKDKIITCEDAEVFKMKLVLGGDSSDGIPNVLSDDDTFINGDKRQKACGEKKIQKILSEGLDKLFVDTQIRKNFERNQKMVILSEQFIPEKVWSNIKKELHIKSEKRKSIFEIGNILREHNFDALVSRINDFA